MVVSSRPVKNVFLKENVKNLAISDDMDITKIQRFLWVVWLVILVLKVENNQPIIQGKVLN